MHYTIDFKRGKACKGAAGNWYVARRAEPTAEQPVPKCEYLHTDGVWRPLTSHERKYTGYFATSDDAKNALKAVQ